MVTVVGVADLSNLRICLFDSDSGSTRVTKQALVQAGCKPPDHYSDPETLMAELLEQPVDLLLVDFTTSGEAGVHLIADLRDLDEAISRSLRILALIAAPTRDAVNQVVYAGTDGILVKPLVPVKISATLQQLMKAHLEYVDAPHYHGPNRRRLPDEAIYQGQERRHDE